MSDQPSEAGQQEGRSLKRRKFLQVSGAATVGTAGALLGGAGGASANEAESEELAVLEIVTGLHPHLSSIASILTRAREKRLQYPIIRRRQLLVLADEGLEATFGDVTLNYRNSIQFIPKEFFPIGSERDFAQKLYLAFARGDAVHGMEDRRHTTSMTPNSGIAFLPSPRPFTDENIG